MQLSAVFARPTARTSAPSDSILQIEGGGAIHALGTVYLPSGAVKLKLHGATNGQFERGIVVNSIDVTGLPNVADFTPFSLPDGGNYTDRLATFEAFLTGETTPVLTARVRFCDVHPADAFDTDIKVPCAGKAKGPAKILAWDAKR